MLEINWAYHLNRGCPQLRCVLICVVFALVCVLVCQNAFYFIAHLEKVALLCPSNQTVPLNKNASTKIVFWSMPQIIGNSADNVKIACSLVTNVSEFSLGTTQVSCNASNDSDVIDTCVFSVIVYGKFTQLKDGATIAILQRFVKIDFCRKLKTIR